MRGHDEQTHHMFSYLSPEQRVPADHPLRAVRALTDHALKTMSRRFASLYAKTGRPSIPPEQLLRALVLQVLYTVRSERLLMEELNDNLLFRWFVGLNMDDPVWHPTTFTKNRDRLLAGDVAAAFFDAVRAQAQAAALDRWSIERIWRPGARYGAPEAAAQGDQGTEHGHRAAVEAPRRADARQLPHEQPEIEAADMHEHTLQDVGLPAQMRAAHPPGRVEMRVGTFEPLAPLPQQPLPTGAPNPPAIGIDRVTGRGLALPVAPPAIRLRDIT